jgi:serine/threonine protein kinase
MLAEQMIGILEFGHSRHLLHRDIEPANFLIVRNSRAAQVHLIDFGYAKRYRNPQTLAHIPYQEGKKWIGSRYSSVNTQKGIEQSRRDDVEALGHVFIYVLAGKLPWQRVPASTKEAKHAKIGEIKENTTAEALCIGLPQEIFTYMAYCKGLNYADCPDYAYLKSLFRELLARERLECDLELDWRVLGAGEGRLAAVYRGRRQGNGMLLGSCRGERKGKMWKLRQFRTVFTVVSLPWLVLSNGERRRPHTY